MKTIGDMTVSGKHVPVRADLNVPLDGIGVRGSR
jgi:3-phosphoglycerate kinase